MDSTRDPAAVAYQLAETVRALNTLTDKPQAFATVGDVRDVAEGLHLAVDQLPQTLRQLSAGLRLLEEQGAIRMEDGTDTLDGVSGALRACLNGEVGLTVARAALRETTGSLARMGCVGG
ncbi:hypothetical protein OG301_39060 (plasmid) [Streptomyces platensis]|uniref:hypothetical protein n=1 Tax=Streptomyces platensis TaxID=58346 RepID=UPI002ED4B4AB|nr:hypothetical protein OG301_39060 [Streptomyces platensis]